MKAFRILKNSVRDSFKSVFRNFSLSMASIVCTTITLILVAIAIIISANVNYVTSSLEKELTIVVYLNSEVTDEEVLTIQNKIEDLANVESVTYKSKEEWKLEMMGYSDTLNVTLEYLDTNPLLDSFTVVVKEVNDLAPTSASIEEIEGVSNANYGEGMVEEIISAFTIIKNATIIIVISLIVVTAFLINNTIKLTIFSRRNEIDIMRLVGSSNTAIKLPFIFEGFLLGVIGSILPIIITIYGYFIVYQNIGASTTLGIFEFIKPMPFVIYASICLLIIGSLVGMFGSSRAVRKYLKI